MVNSLILYSIGLISGIAIVTLLNNSNKGRSGAKGITQEYTSKDGVTRTAKKDREDHIVWVPAQHYSFAGSLHFLLYLAGSRSQQ